MDKKELYKKIKHSKKAKKLDLIIELCKNKNVLDVGCVGQDYNINTDEWLHRKIKTVANSIDGVDIVDADYASYKSQGYNIFHFEKLKSFNKKYDIILMADVIEHVDNPVEFINIYSNYLNENGRMLITTPNALNSANFFSVLLINNYSINPEHTFWLCPKTIFEICNRANVQIEDFYWLRKYYTIKQVRGLIPTVLYVFSGLLTIVRKQFSPNFMVILKK